MSETKRDDETLIVRHLVGFGTDAESAVLARRLAADPALAARVEAGRRAWDGLELPPPGPIPPGFASRIAARARFVAGPQPRGLAPGRLAAAAALLLGLALGSLLSLRIEAANEEEIAATTIAARYLAAADATDFASDDEGDTLGLQDEEAMP